MQHDLVSYAVRDRVAKISMNRGPVNAIHECSPVDSMHPSKLASSSAAVK